MPGTLIAGSRTLFSNGGAMENAYTGKMHNSVWWNSWQSRWDGLIPMDETGDSDHYIVKDIGGAETQTAIELEDRSSGLPTICWKDAEKRLYVASFHDSTTEYWEIAYDSGTDTYSFSVGAIRAGETVTGISRSGGRRVDGGSMIVVPNGDVWVALIADGALILNRRTGGSWNGSVVTLRSSLGNGAVALNYFTNAGTTHVYVFGAEDDLDATPLWHAFFIDEDAAAPFTPGNWTDDTPPDPQVAVSADSDNHCDSVRNNATEDIFIVAKTGNAIAGETLNCVLKRTPAGVYTTHEASQKQVSVNDDRTRPCIALDGENDKLYVAFNKQSGAGDLPLYYVTADLADLDTWAAEVALFEVATRDFGQARSPQQDTNVTALTGLLFVCEQDAVAGGALGEGDDMYQTLVTIAPATPPAPPSTRSTQRRRRLLYA